MNYNNSLRSKTAEPSAMSVPPRLLRGSGQFFRNHYLWKAIYQYVFALAHGADKG
jgi:hypothetical protein